MLQIVRQKLGGEKFVATDFGTVEDLKGEIKKLAGEVFCGNMDIAPLEIENIKTEPCKYCSFGDLCRNKKQEEEDDGDVGADE